MKYPLIFAFLLIFTASCTINIGTDDDDSKSTENTTTGTTTIKPSPNIGVKKPDGSTIKIGVKKNGQSFYDSMMSEVNTKKIAKAYVLGTTTVDLSVTKKMQFTKPSGYTVMSKQERDDLNDKGIEAMGAQKPLFNPLKYGAKKNNKNVFLITSSLELTKDVMERREKMMDLMARIAQTYEGRGMDIETSQSKETINNQQYRKQVVTVYVGNPRSLFLTQEMYVAFIDNNLTNITLSYDNIKDSQAQHKALNSIAIKNKTQGIVRPNSN